LSFNLFQTPKQQKVLLVLWIAFVAMSYCIHQAAFTSAGIALTTFTYSLVSLYVLFGVFSIGVLVTVFQVRKRNFDLVGMSFLIATTVKLMVCSLFLRPILKSVSASAAIEKINFFVLFIVFLAIETVVTILILNEKQENTSKSLK
jgi:hypothetical protein